MGKASRSKNQAKAASAAKSAVAASSGKSSGGGGGSSWLTPAVLFPVAIALVVVGFGAIAIAGRERPEGEAPMAGVDHWHAAYGVWNCDGWERPFADTRGDRFGMHTHQDGLIHMHPFGSGGAGVNATLETFGEEVSMELDNDKLKLPDGTELENGDDCGGEEGQVRLKRWNDPNDAEGEFVDPETTNFGDYRPQNGEVLAIVFAPESTEIPLPPTVTRLDNPLAAENNEPLVPIDDNSFLDPEGSVSQGLAENASDGDPESGESEADDAGPDDAGSDDAGSDDAGADDAASSDEDAG